ncbi:Uncharacterised protein [uncultured archaeon]|nr:Uncharacterised protein [uncultured archaeon]
MSRKGKLTEIFSKAMYTDNPNSYIVGYLDYNIIKEVTLPEFIKISDNFEIIPITRIQHVMKGNDVLYSKVVNKKDSNIL